jgi:TPR repeat protein
MRNRTRTALAATLAVLLSTAVQADPRNDADAAYGRGDFAAGLALDRTSAAAGDVRAMINLGDAYVTGRGVEKDTLAGLTWYVAAAEKGSDLEGPILGSPRDESDDASAVAFNREVARKIKADNDTWFPILSTAGPGDDIYNRAARARHSREVTVEELRSTLTDAVIVRNVQAMVSLAYLYENEVRPANPTEALRLYERAAVAGRADAMARLAGMYFSAAMNSDGLRWLRSAAEAGDVEATARLAGIYEDGHLVPRDTREAFRLNLIAAEKGRTWSALHVAEAYHDGHGVARDFAQAARWFQVAADDPTFSMNDMAKYGLAVMYLDGRGVPRDPARAVQLLRDAAAENQAEAMELLGTLELLGHGTVPDARDAMRLYNEAAKYGRTVGTYDLGVVYATGRAGVADPALAQVWFEKAAGAGEKIARARLNGTPNPLLPPDDLLLPDQIRNGFTVADCIRSAGAQGLSPYNGPPDATLELAAPVRIEDGRAVLDLVVSASDPDGDPLTYSYEFGSEVYTGLGTHATLRTEPADSYLVTVVADDGHGCAMRRWETFERPAAPRPPEEPARAIDVVLVDDPPGTRCAHTGAQSDVRADTGQYNRPPDATIEQVSSRVTPEGTVLTLHVTGSDPDGDQLVYLFTVLDGSFSGDETTDITWQLSDGDFHMLSAEVTDLHGCTRFTSFTPE